jgi:hypothetical protein
MCKRFSWEKLDSGKETQVSRPFGKAGVDVRARARRVFRGSGL